MKYTSQTGLLSSKIKPIIRRVQSTQINLETVAVAPPFFTKPFAGLYNPFSNGCSILCNHPAQPEVKKVLQKAKENMGQDGKAVLLPSDVAAIRAEFEQFQLMNKENNSEETDTTPSNPFLNTPNITEIVPEELFRRYTETDSRPLTPAPTIASAHTRASASRRCVTPDPIYTSTIKEKTMLILDLRRSHSQETLSCYAGSAHLNETPLIRIMNVELTPASSRHSLHVDRKQQFVLKSPKRKTDELNVDKTRLQVPDEKFLEVPVVQEVSDDEEYVKRRGKKRKKRRASSSASMFHTSADPETLVAGVDPESKNPSARPSLTLQQIEEMEKFQKNKLDDSRSFNIDSFMDYETLRALRRELTKEMVEMEFDQRRKIALEEALKTVPSIRINCEELKELQKSTLLPFIDSELRFSLPRKFKRSGVRFELPMDSRTFNGMTSMQYLKDHVCLTSAKKLLYSYVFNIHRIKPEASESEDGEQGISEENEDLENKDTIREISGQEIISALGTLMGKTLTETQATEFHEIIGWSMDTTYDFHIFSSICAACERILASEFYPNLPDRREDPCQSIEKVDFEALDRKIRGKSMNAQLQKLLDLIRTA